MSLLLCISLLLICAVTCLDAFMSSRRSQWDTGSGIKHLSKSFMMTVARHFPRMSDSEFRGLMQGMPEFVVSAIRYAHLARPYHSMGAILFLLTCLNLQEIQRFGKQMPQVSPEGIVTYRYRYLGSIHQQFD